MESVDPLKHVCELCDDAFCQRHFHSRVDKMTCLTTWSDLTMSALETAIEKKKTWATAQSHQMTTLNHHLPKEVDFTVCTKKCWAHCNLSFLRRNMLHMQHHFLCNIGYVVIAASMRNTLKYTTKNYVHCHMT